MSEGEAKVNVITNAQVLLQAIDETWQRFMEWEERTFTRRMGFVACPEGEHEFELPCPYCMAAL